MLCSCHRSIVGWRGFALSVFHHTPELGVMKLPPSQTLVVTLAGERALVGLAATTEYLGPEVIYIFSYFIIHTQRGQKAHSSMCPKGG